MSRINPDIDVNGDDAFDANEGDAPALSLDRRSFVKLAVTAAAASAITQQAAAQARGGGAGQQQPQAPPIPLENGEHPALVFQAYPGGTGALMEKLARERGYAAFERKKIEVEPWKGAVPTSAQEIAFLPTHRQAALIKAKKLTSVQLTEIYLERLKRLNPQLLAAVTIMEAQGMEEARRADAEIKSGKYRGPLHGIPYGVKDLFAVKGVPTTWGAKDFETRVLDYDSEIVLRLRDAGAVLIAKLATGLFAQNDGWYGGQTKNPWNLAQGSSGSSAGPGSATAAGCVSFGIGTETQGSIVSPAARNGISALRPTFGRVSRHGGMVLAWSMDKAGPMCRTVEDCALVFNAIHGADEKDPATLTTPFQFDRNINLGKLRIGFDDRAPKEFVDKLRELGADPKPMPPRPNTGSISGLGSESAAAFDYFISKLPADVDTAALRVAGAAALGGGGGPAGARNRFTRGRTALAMDFLNNQRRRLIIMRQMADVMKEWDMYVSGQGDVGLTNQTGHPAVVLPYRMSDGANNTPIQPTTTTIIGNLFEDDKILSVAHAYQKATDWHLKHPQLG